MKKVDNIQEETDTVKLRDGNSKKEGKIKSII